MGLDYKRVDTTYTPTRWRRMAIHLIEDDPRDWAMLDPTSKTWYQYVYDNVAAEVAGATSLALDSSTDTTITFTFADGAGGEPDSYAVFYAEDAGGSLAAADVKSTGTEFLGTIAKAGTTLTGLTASTQYAIVVESTSETGSELSNVLLVSTVATVAQAINLTETATTSSTIEFTFDDGTGATPDTYTVFYAEDAGGTLTASDVETTGIEFVGTVDKLGTTVTGLTAATQYAVIVKTENSYSSQLSAVLLSTTAA